MKTCTTIQLHNGGLRSLALALGDGRICNAELPGRDIGKTSQAMIAILGDVDPNVRIGACRLVKQHADLLVHTAPEDLLEQIQKTLQNLLSDLAANDYAYGGFQCDEEDIQYVADEARMALGSLTTFINCRGTWVVARARS